ncbi:MAG TPA: hypothetical protein VFA05_04785 [Gaiellaceae bacterium]|nr:hypothetical protein [Gaiellaceae bacterium]
MRRTAAILAGACAAVASTGAAAPATLGAPAAAACSPRLSFGVLPVWARSGFSDPRPRLPHAVGRGGRIAALVFGYPLLSPPSRTRANKILWVPRRPPAAFTALRIHAQRMDGTRPLGRPVRVVLAGGAGPSIVDFPAPGCWRLTLRWAGTSDTLDLRYRANR